MIGLDNNFLAIKTAGMLCYGSYNVGLYSVVSIQTEYFAAHPHGVLPVTITDILLFEFSVKFIQMVPREYRVNVLITFIMEHHLHHYEPHPCNILHFPDYTHGL